jgi:hypothetical protein
MPSGTAPVRVAATAPTSPQAAPLPPPLPFRYLGRMVGDDRSVVFLEHGPNVYSVAVGDVLESAYSVESITETAVTFRHTALGVQQSLAIPRAP